MSEETKAPLPKSMPPKSDSMGDWWITVSPTKHTCTSCHKAHEEHPAVLRYNAKLDPDGEQKEMHPGWAQSGWLAWWDCTLCGRETYEVVTRQQILDWAKRLGGWKPMD